ncbi:sugar phosphate nucleotidyltransferase, partial [Planktomarina temperata]|nr:sugar phosphate nucleotidyltransferase [Planktomarina temperata]
MRQPPHELMLFAAGFGSRMQPLTADLPKPLITVAGTSLLDRTLRLAEAGGITKTVVNTHYLGEK